MLYLRGAAFCKRGAAFCKRRAALCWFGTAFTHVRRISEWFFITILPFLELIHYLCTHNKKSIMNKVQLFLAFAFAGMIFVSCKEKNKSNDIIAPKPVKEVQTGPASMEVIKQDREVDWVGSQYRIEIVRTPDKELALTKDEAGKKYYDNRITVKILRKDGSQFFGRTFTKADFVSYLDESTRRDGALLGIVLDKAEENQLRFAASVGSPDVLSDQYIPMLLTITRMGAVSIVKDTEEEDEGV